MSITTCNIYFINDNSTEKRFWTPRAVEAPLRALQTEKQQSQAPPVQQLKTDQDPHVQWDKSSTLHRQKRLFRCDGQRPLEEGTQKILYHQIESGEGPTLKTASEEKKYQFKITQARGLLQTQRYLQNRRDQKPRTHSPQKRRTDQYQFG